MKTHIPEHHLNRKKKVKKSRKSPVQSRSKATVDAIIQATTYILNEAGWDGLTTNAIAERAGVNISSLYQYFPNKEAIVAELQNRHADAVHADLYKALLQFSEHTSLRTVLTQVIEIIVNEHRIAPAVQNAVDELPRTLRNDRDNDIKIHTQLMDVAKPLMQNVPDKDLALYLIVTAAHAIIHRVALDKPELLDDPILKEELITLFEGYISRPGNTKDIS